MGVKVYRVAVKDLAGRLRTVGSADNQEGEKVIRGTHVILDPNEPDGQGNPGQVTTAFRTTTATTSSGRGVAIFSVVPAAGLNIFSAVAWDLTSAGDGSGAQANVCGFSQPQKIYIKIWGTQ